MGDNGVRDAYFTDLAARLRERGVTEERITATIDDLATYLSESGTDPEEEFGPAADFARRLCADDEAAGDAASAPASGTWKWTADIFIDQQRLNEFGAQGWEVETVDKNGMFVSRRDPERPQRWEYRREVVRPARRAALAESLAPDGWEPCGTWWYYAYFKRPLAASVGPTAEVASPPPAPRARLFLSGRYYLLAACTIILLVLAAVVIGWMLDSVTPIEILDYAAGAVVGAAVAFAVGLWVILRNRDS